MWKKFIAILKMIAAYTVAHPFTYDVLAGFFAYLSASLGWFKPWVPACLILYLLGRIYRLRRKVIAYQRTPGGSLSASRGADGIIRPDK